jgi:hypothetical protein
MVFQFSDSPLIHNREKLLNRSKVGLFPIVVILINIFLADYLRFLYCIRILLYCVTWKKLSFIKHNIFKKYFILYHHWYSIKVYRRRFSPGPDRLCDDQCQIYDCKLCDHRITQGQTAGTD